MNHLGKYVKMPPTIELLKELENILVKEGYSLDLDFGLILESDYFAYDVTPYDVIPFASTGCDGIHFGLLTDFGTVSDLENAFVVCVSPMDFGSHIKVVARNISEFVSLICTLKGAVTIANLNSINKEEQYQSLLKELKQEEIDNKEFIDRTNYVIEKIQSKIKCEIIEDVYQYVERTVKNAREEQTILPTLDGLGIIALENGDSGHRIFQLEKDMKINLKEVKSFFNTATTESKLAFIRDAQFTYLISDERELKELVIKEMIKLRLHDEVERLRKLGF